ncbi:MAG: hypothetical protein A3A97_04925 [Candidatus Terrybacteria bacterium RIFCSPLOWO2_01_FULL_40_23]|uniref:Uncharacterized protein n=1 Tax=Candidatus Terrybacteria bacterium RIFCSPLOWO2_01_FULL_40_23 TaxID=1802366 RepID=A0A1G2PWS9_9BACT|nr:MAG: hypothetical protein A3A97_04925 [Candidatus Terrybacteria bacterium RIFCSPLOWO2_01_FULL_40_23]
MENPRFLKEKYDLHNAPEVAQAAERTESKAGERVPQDPEARIQNYLDRLERLALDPAKEQRRTMFANEPRPRAIGLLREMVMNKYVRPNKEKMAEGAARVEERAARELGIGAHYGEQELEQRGEIAVKDLEKSLDNWISYLSDANEPYPTWFRYYAFRNVLDLGDYDKDKGEFTKRSQGSTRLFPEIDRGALAYVQEIIEASKDPEMLERLQKAQRITGTPEDQMITKEKAVNFAKLSFAKQYVEGIKQAGEITLEMREETRGKWAKYQQGTDPTALWASLQNKGTAWCTKGFATAETQLNNGDFYVYYTNDSQGTPSIPRIAIRMQEDSIFEVRGVADNQQNLEGNMIDIAEEKMKELPGAEKYRKTSADMKTLTAIEIKMKADEALTKDDLIFLYELNAPIEGFGYDVDPRIKELRSQRNPEEDMPIVFECTREQIAHTSQQINETTRVYVGKLEPGIFDKLQQYNIEHIYTKFPENRIRKETIEIGGKDVEILIREMRKKHININDYAMDMLESKDFTVLEETEDVVLVRLKVGDLGFPQNKYPTTDEIYTRIQELELELCPAEVGPRYCLQYTDQPVGEWFLIGMKQIAGRNGSPSVFNLGRNGGGLWLLDAWTEPSGEWRPDNEFTFRLRKLGNLET